MHYNKEFCSTLWFIKVLIIFLAPFDDLALCKVGDKVYHEGQKFYPEEEPCLSCICQPGFNETFKQPHCVPLNCHFEPKIRELRDHCTPIYQGTKRCCATHWTCRKNTQIQIFPLYDSKFNSSTFVRIFECTVSTHLTYRLHPPIVVHYVSEI